MSLGVELAALVVVCAFVIIAAELRLKPEYIGQNQTLVRVGCAIHGFTLGLFVGFVLLPLRAIGAAAANAQGLTDWERTALAFAFAPSLILFIVLRRGALSRFPVIGRPLRAYRRASLRQQIASAQLSLARLTARDEVAGPSALFSPPERQGNLS